MRHYQARIGTRLRAPAVPEVQIIIMILGESETVQERPVQAQVRRRAHHQQVDHHRRPLCQGEADHNTLGVSPSFYFYLTLLTSLNQHVNFVGYCTKQPSGQDWRVQRPQSQ